MNRVVSASHDGRLRAGSSTLKLLAKGFRALALAVWLPALAGGQTPGVEVADLGGLEARSAALILSGQEAGDLEISVLAIPMPGPGDAGATTRVVLVVDVDGKSLLAGAGEEALVTEIYVGTVDGLGGLGGVLTQACRIDLARHRAALAAGGIKFLGHLDLVPGDYSLRVLVSNRRSGRLRLEVESLTVQPAQPRALLPPLFPEPVERWIVVREKSAAELPFPRFTDGRAWVPATRPRVVDRASFYLAGRGLAGGLRAHVVGGERDEVISELGLGDLRPVDDPPPGFELVAAEIRTTGLAGGRHRLRISFADGAGETSIPLSIPVSEAELAVGAELDEMSADFAAGTGKAVAVARGHAQLRLLEQTRAAYVAALGHLDAGDLTRALTALIALERAGIGEQLTEDTAKVREQLQNTEMTVAIQLAGDQAESLVPLLSLHEQLYRRYYQSRHYFLAGHARQVLAALAGVYVERSRAPEAAALVADAMASLGGFLQQAGARQKALELYQQALLYDPEQPTSLLASAMIYEAFGDYPKASELLHVLVAEDSGDRRAKLHLAVNSRRLEAKRLARKLLTECIAADATDWITALAYQELAALHAGDKRSDEAIAVLEEAVERMPGQQASYLQLAALYDRAGRPSQATEVLRRLDSRASGDAASPRLLYGEPPYDYIARSRQVLASGVETRLPTLVERASQLAAAGEGGDASPDPGRP